MLALYAINHRHEESAGYIVTPIETPIDPLEVEPVDPFEQIRSLLNDPAARTWVFTGDDYGFSADISARSWSDLFKDFVRQSLGRNRDAVIDSSVREGTITRLLDDIEWRILRYKPDVVILSTGNGEVADEVDDRESVRVALTQLIEFLHTKNCAVILCTPPAVESAQAILHPGVDAFARLIRAVAGETGSLLVDHHDRWLRTLKQPGFSVKLFQSDGVRPSRDGHLKLTRQLLRSLGVLETGRSNQNQGEL